MNILFEDESLVVVNKPAGLSSETGVPDALRAQWGRGEAPVYLVHRLDQPVSGLMVCAKTPEAAAALSRQVTQSQAAYAALDAGENGEMPRFLKQYRAVLGGIPDEHLPAEGLLHDYLFKDSRTGRVYPVKRPRKGVREAVLAYRIVGTAEGLSLAEITLHTGRTHQIRVQFAARRHPLWGDGKYGSKQKGPIALQSAGLCFDHPVTGRRMEFSLPPPEGIPWNYFIKAE